MASIDLLPPNATQLERDVATASDFLAATEDRVPYIRTAKRIDIPDDVVPWLIYEYGLGELLPYLPDPRVAIEQGVLWQRYRGTPAAIKTALGWINFQALLEESEAGTIRWAQYQLGLDQAPSSLDFINSVIGISRVSSPARSDLFRLYGGWYDYRRFKLDEHLLSEGSWLCDHTGVYLRDDWPQLSFGREHSGPIAPQELQPFPSREHIEAELYVYEDRFILSQSPIDEFWHLLQEATFTASRLHFSIAPATAWDIEEQSWATAPSDWNITQAWRPFSVLPELQYARAGVYLSDYAVLGDTNCCLPCRDGQEFGDGAFLLSEANFETGESVLGQHQQRWEYVEINERLERQTASVVETYIDGGVEAQAVDRLTKRLIKYEDHFWLDYGRLDEDAPSLLESTIRITRTTLQHRYSIDLQTWAAAPWQDGGNWAGSFGEMDNALTFAVSGIYLSDSDPLGASDATFSFREDLGGGLFQEITDRGERQIATIAAPYTGSIGVEDKAVFTQRYAAIELVGTFNTSAGVLDEEWHSIYDTSIEIISTSFLEMPQDYPGWSYGTWKTANDWTGRYSLPEDSWFARNTGIEHDYAGATFEDRQHQRQKQTTTPGASTYWVAWDSELSFNDNYEANVQWNHDSDPDTWISEAVWSSTNSWSVPRIVWNWSVETVSSAHHSHP